MSDDAYPLHVQVAEALGWQRIDGPRPSIMSQAGMAYDGQPPGPVTLGRPPERIPRYDTDWSATGPLIERNSFALDLREAGWAATALTRLDDEVGLAIPYEVEFGATPLVAVCKLIVALKGR